jgi:hypothetical protein
LAAAAGDSQRTQPNRVATFEDLCPQSCSGHRSLRFSVVVTARFRILFVFVALEIGSRRILHCNVTAHPTAEWTLQQLRDAIPSDHPYHFLIHDRDTIFSSELDAEVKSTFGLRVTAYASPGTSGECVCERLIGTVRRERLDFMIPLHDDNYVEPCGHGWLTIIKDAPIRA